MRVVVALGLLLLCACVQRSSVIDRAQDLPEGFDLRMANVVYQRIGARGLISQAHIAEVLLAPSTGELRFKRVEMTHYLSAAERFVGPPQPTEMPALDEATSQPLAAQPATAQPSTVRVLASSGEAQLYSGRFLLRGAVRLDDGAGRVLDAPSAAYDPDSHTLAGVGPASLRGENFVINAEQGYVVDAQAQTVELLGPVSGVVEGLER